MNHIRVCGTTEQPNRNREPCPELHAEVQRLRAALRTILNDAESEFSHLMGTTRCADIAREALNGTDDTEQSR